MTIRVTVTNEDPRDSAVISVERQNSDGTPTYGHPNKLKGGESREEWVFEGQQLLVKEVRE